MAENNNNNIPAYLDESLSFEERAADLVSRMTLEEKAAQLNNEAAAVSRLGVRAYNYWREGLHGVARQGKATSFPTSLSMANTWNRGLVRRAAKITADEARGKNPVTNLSYWSPTVNMARDPRWGRNEETYGEDPYLAGQLGSEFVKGMQGDDGRYIETIATVKHFIANNVEKERRMGTSVMSEQTLRDYYGRVFQNIVEGAKPASAMSSYNATTIYRCGKLLYDYVPSTANPYILKELLRRNWGFTGYVTGDCGAFGDLNNTAAYKTALFPGEALQAVPQSATITKGFLNGADTDCGYSATAGSVLEAVKNGDISEDELNINIYNLFLQRMRTGEFDKAPKYRDITPDVLEIPEHIAVAEEAAEQSWVLLKNSGILPLGKNVKRVALVGALADEVVLGDYSGSPEQTVTPYEGIAAELKRTNPNAVLEYLGGATDGTKLMNVLSLNLIKRGGETVEIDLGGTENAEGMDVRGGYFNVTRKGKACLRGIDFSGVVSVKADIEALAGGKMKLYYGFGGPQVAEIHTQSESGAAECGGEYTGEAGGYNRTEDLYIEFEADAGGFSVDKYKTELDAADIIIAYAGTTLSDSAEFNDRSSIDLPQSQSHVGALTEAYPEKTIVTLQTVGQIDTIPFESGAAAMLWTSYNGQTQGTALGKILTGQANPCGKLTTTWYSAADLEKMPVGVPGVTGDDGIVRYYNNYEIKPGDNFPGRTYQYNTGKAVYPFGFGLSYTEFEYSGLRVSASEVDAGGSIEVKVDVTNTGSVTGMETVQFYIGYPGGSGLPEIQLKGFDKLELCPGETKTASAVIPIFELRFFDEKSQKTRVALGKYKVYASKNSANRGLCKEFTVIGGIKPSLKTVAALPDGIIVRGLVGGGVETVTGVSANLSAVLNDESRLELSGSNTAYSSADENIARVDGNGTVLPGTKAGVTLITASVTYEGVTKSVKFPIVNIPEFKATDDEKQAARTELLAKRSEYFSGAYTDEGLRRLDEILNGGMRLIDGAVKKAELDAALSDAVYGFERVTPERLEMDLKIVSPDVKNGVTETHGVIRLAAEDKNGSRAEAEWHIETLSKSARTAAVIDKKTGEMTASANGLVKVRAVNIDKLIRGEALIYINLPIEAESADDGKGADLTAKDGGTESGGYAASTKSRAMEYKGLRLENLVGLRLRYSLPGESAAARFKASGITVAEGVLTPTGGECAWRETEISADPAALQKCGVDENGLGTLSLIAGDANIDRFALIYEKTDIDTPYKIAAVENGAKGLITVYVRYVGGGEPMPAELTCGNVSVTVSGRGAYEIETNAAEGEELKLILCGKSKRHKYSEPKPKRRVVYLACDPAYAALFNSAGKVKLPEINGLTGYGPLKRHTCSEYGYRLGDDEYKFTCDWQGGEGSETASCLFFMPSAPCDVTVIYDGGEDREQYIVQSGVRLAAGLSTPRGKTAISARITDVSAPVYTFGGGANKSVYAIIVDYHGGDEPDERTIQSAEISGGFARLAKTSGGESKIYLSETGRVWSEADLSLFGIRDLSVSCIAAYKDRLYAGCGGGEVLIITDCPKCRVSKKLCGFDIEGMEIINDVMILTGGGNRKEISMTVLGADRIGHDEALRLIAGGAVAIDVREAEVFNSEPSKIDGSVNIPLTELEKISAYSRDSVIVFCCSRGIWSSEAVLRAKEMGYKNVYYLY